MTRPLFTNANYSASTAERLPVHSTWLSRPEQEWTYCHHPHMAFFQDRFYAIWSNGREDEDAPGQRVLLSQSSDGLMWTAPRPLLDSQRGRDSELVLTACGLHVYGGQLMAYIGAYELAPEALTNGKRLPGDVPHRDTQLWLMRSADGERWQGPEALGLRIVPNHGPQRTAGGRLIMAGNVMFPWTDDPAGVSGWHWAGLVPAQEAAEIVDDSEGFWRVWRKQKWAVPCCEAALVEPADGTLHMLLRTNTERLWASQSCDRGASWSAPQATDFSDNATKFHFGRLHDGRWYYVGCPDAAPRWQRCPLVLSLSEDGYRFDRHYILGEDHSRQNRPGLYKVGEYGYPHTLEHDGRLYVIVSRQKECIQVLRVSIAALGYDLGTLPPLPLLRGYFSTRPV